MEKDNETDVQEEYGPDAQAAYEMDYEPDAQTMSDEEGVEDKPVAVAKTKAAAKTAVAHSKNSKSAALYRIIMLALSIVILVVAIRTLVKVSGLSKNDASQVTQELENTKDVTSDENVSNGVVDTGEIHDGDLTLEDIQAMDSNTIIDTYLISKTNARKNNYNADNLIQDSRFWYYEENGDVTSKTGIDVSSYQGDIDWNKVADSGIEFAIIRVGIRGYGSGKLVADEKYKDNLVGAKKAGLKVGVYFFSQAITKEEAKEEADFVYDAIKNYDVDLPVVYDSEKVLVSSARTNKAELTSDERTDIAIAFCDRIKEKGYDACIYASKRWFLRYLNLEKLDDYGLWLAQYSTDLDFPFHFGMWQYTDTGAVDGIDGDVDIDIMFGGDDW